VELRSYPIRDLLLQQQPLISLAAMSQAKQCGNYSHWCGPKPKTCFFGDHACGSNKFIADDGDSGATDGDDLSTYPVKSCTCEMKHEACVLVVRGYANLRCIVVQEEDACVDATLAAETWADTFGEGCSEYEQFNTCAPSSLVLLSSQVQGT
jgi:hypothetical protein